MASTSPLASRNLDGTPMAGTPGARCGPEAWGRGGGGGLGGGLWGEMSELPGAYVHGRGLRHLGLTPGHPELRCFAEIHSTDRAGTGTRACLRRLSGPGTSPSTAAWGMWLTERMRRERDVVLPRRLERPLSPRRGSSSKPRDRSVGTAGGLADGRPEADMHLICLLSPF